MAITKILMTKQKTSTNSTSSLLSIFTMQHYASVVWYYLMALRLCVCPFVYGCSIKG